MRSLILDACLHNDITHATYLLDHGAPVNARGDNEITPLILAAMRNPDMVKLLIAHGANLELKGSNGYTALGSACWTGQTACAKVLIDAGANTQVLNNMGHTPLILAVEAGDDDLVQALIDHHADVNQAADDGSAIWWAIGKDRPKELAMLLSAGADFQAHNTAPPPPDLPGYTIIGRAAVSTDTAIVDMLLAHGANINEPDARGRTPLFVAVQESSAPMILDLLQKGADATTADSRGYTPLMVAMTFQQKPVWDALLQHGATIDAKDHLGRTALSYESQILFLASVHWLVEHGADVNAADILGNTPLLYAGDRGGTKIRKFLTDHGAHPVDLHIIAKPRPAPPPSPSHQWALATAALYVQWNGLNPYELGGGENASRAAKSLQKDWGIHDRTSLEKVVHNLQTRGQRRDFQYSGAKLAAIPTWLFWLITLRSSTESLNISKAIRQNYLSWSERSGLAGDLCRAAFLVNEGYACHYLDEDQAWNLLLPIARDVQGRFTSWHEMCDNFLDAREMWVGSADPDLDVCGDLLCNSNDPNSPWNNLPWQTALSAP